MQPDLQLTPCQHTRRSWARLPQYDDTVKLLELISRSKYDEAIGMYTNNTTLVRNIVTSADADDFMRQIMRLETSIGSYTVPPRHANKKDSSDGYDHYNGELIVTDSNLVVYLRMNGKSLTSAVLGTQHTLQKFCLDPGAMAGYDPRQFEEHLRSSLAKGHTVRRYIDIEIDTKDAKTCRDLHAAVFPLVTHAFVCLVETMNGFHLVLNADRMRNDAKTALYNLVRDSKYSFTTTNRTGHVVQKNLMTFMSDACIPVPGTMQAGFAVKLRPCEYLGQMSD